MSCTYSLVCHETRSKIWIGQGWGELATFYSGEPVTMGRLRRFLNEHREKPLFLLCNDLNDEIADYQEFEPSDWVSMQLGKKRLTLADVTRLYRRICRK